MFTFMCLIYLINRHEFRIRSSSCKWCRFVLLQEVLPPGWRFYDLGHRNLSHQGQHQDTRDLGWASSAVSRRQEGDLQRLLRLIVQHSKAFPVWNGLMAVSSHPRGTGGVRVLEMLLCEHVRRGHFWDSDLYLNVLRTSSHSKCLAISCYSSLPCPVSCWLMSVRMHSLISGLELYGCEMPATPLGTMSSWSSTKSREASKRLYLLIPLCHHVKRKIQFSVSNT